MAERITHDKPYDLKGEVNARMIQNVDEMFGQLYWYITELETRLGKAEGVLASPGETQTAAGAKNTEWLTGPWVLDKVVPTDNIAVVRNDPISGATLNNWAPDGIDTAVAVELEPTGNITITGIKQTILRRRLLGIINRDSSAQITLVHASASSSSAYRFNLPSSANVVIGPREAAWLYYNIGSQNWQLFITPHTSGGLASNVKLAEVTISDAAMKSLSTTPVTLISAPGAGLSIGVIGTMRFACNITANGGTSVNGTVRFTPSNTTLYAASTMITAASNGARETAVNASTFNTMGTSHENEAIEIVGSANAGAAYASTDGFHIALAYYTFSDPN